MAKILEALRQAGSAHLRDDGPPPARPYQPEDGPDVDPVGPEGEVPFIEVGGPHRAVEGSASVMAGAAPTTREARPERPVTPPRPAAPARGIAAGPARTFVAVTFCPLPADPAPLRPAYERFAPELVAFHQPEHPVGEQYRTLLAALEAQQPEEHSRVLLFTAAVPQAGTTTVLLNLAITCARRGQLRVALVDANFPRPAVAERLGLRAAPGLREVLAGAVSPQRALQETGEARLQALTAGSGEDCSAPGLGGEQMRGVLRYLRGHFDRILIDAPCWDGRPDVIALGSACDAVYLVTPRDGADSAGVAELVRSLPRQGVCLRGTILAHR